MISDFSNLRIFVRPGTTDMRMQINGLAALVQNTLELNPLDGSLYLFMGKNRKRLKVLYWDKNGFCLWQKRLEIDRFPWPNNEGAAREISAEQLRFLLTGIDFWKAHRELKFEKVC